MEAEAREFAYAYSAEVEYPTERAAEVALGAVEVDAELSPDKVVRELSREGRVVRVRFRAIEARLLRAAVGAFFDLLGLATRAVEEFGDAALLAAPAAAA